MLAVAACGLGDDGGGGVASDEVSASDVESWITEQAPAWLDGFSGPMELTCAPGSNAEIRPSDERMRACVVGDGQSFFVRAQNLTDVPVSVWGNPATSVFTIEPGAVFDIPLVNPQWGQVLYYRADPAAGLGVAVMEGVQDKIDEQRTGGFSWIRCAVDPDPDCVLDTMVEVLPEQVTVFGRRVPVGVLADGLNLAYQNKDLVNAFADDWTNAAPGTLTILQR